MRRNHCLISDQIFLDLKLEGTQFMDRRVSMSGTTVAANKSTARTRNQCQGGRKRRARRPLRVSADSSVHVTGRRRLCTDGRDPLQKMMAPNVGQVSRHRQRRWSLVTVLLPRFGRLLARSIKIAVRTSNGYACSQIQSRGLVYIFGSSSVRQRQSNNTTAAS